MALFASSAGAQQLTCNQKPNGINFRVESVTDPIGDVFIQCFANDRTPAGQTYVTGDVKVIINTNIANRLGVSGISNLTDVVLIVNENHAAPAPLSTLGGPNKNFPVPQFGQLVGANALQWSSVKIPIPGATAPDGTTFPARTSLRVTNMRVNAAQLGLSSTDTPNRVFLASVTIADASAVPVDNSLPILGTVVQGLTTSVPALGLLPQCQSQNIANGSVSGPPTFSVRFKEGFEYAFRPLGQPTTDQGIRAGEDGYPTPGIGANGGGADQGSRLFVRFNNVGNGVRISAPATVTSGMLSLQLLVNTSFTGTGPYQPVSGNGLTELQVTAGSATALYEVVKSDVTVIESVDIPFVVGYSANSSANLPSPGVTTVNASLAPLTVSFLSSSTAPVPRFADFSVARNAFAINVCRGPAPAISGVTPSSLPAGTGMDATLRVDGSGFSADSIVEWNGAALKTSLGRDANFYLSATVPASLTAHPGMAQLDVSNSDGQRSNTFAFNITGAVPPSINNGGAVNAASSLPILARGSLASLYGVALASFKDIASGFPLPLSLGNAQVKVNGTLAPLIYASANQINFQVPFEAPLTGTASIVVTRDGMDSSPVNVNLAEFAPGIFRSAETPVILHSDYTLVTSAKPAAANEILIAYGTGLGGLLSPPPTGLPAPENRVVAARLLPSITIGGQAAQVQFAGLAADFVGLAQFNFRVPTPLPPGSLQMLVLAYGSNSDIVPLAVSNSANGEITSLSPSSAPFQSPSIALTVNGSGFTSGATVQWSANGQITKLSTTFASSTMLTAQVPANLLATQGAALVTVLNSNGTTSNALTFTVLGPPGISSLNPSSVVAGATAFTLSVSGLNFSSKSVVSWNGTALKTTFVSATQLLASVTSDLVVSASTAKVSVMDSGVSSAPSTESVIASFGANFNFQRVTKEAPPASGCKMPTPQTSFSMADGTVFLYYEAAVTPKDSLSDNWLAPDGTVVEDTFWDPTTGSFCFIGGSLRIPASPLGAWEGRVYDNGALLFAIPFSIVAQPAAAPGEVRRIE